MKAQEKSQTVKMNLSLDREFHQLLKDKAEQDYMQTATWVKRFLMKNLVDGHKQDVKCETGYGKN